MRRWRWPTAWRPGAPWLLVGLATCAPAFGQGTPATRGAEAVDFKVVGDAIPAPLSPVPGDAQRGRALVLDRRKGLCLLCHSGPFPEERFQGNLAPSLAGAGSRWNAGQLRLRVADPKRLNPDSLMPGYHHHRPLQQVAAAQRGQPIFDAQQLEDVVAFLQTLRD